MPCHASNVSLFLLLVIGMPVLPCRLQHHHLPHLRSGRHLTRRPSKLPSGDPLAMPSHKVRPLPQWHIHHQVLWLLRGLNHPSASQGVLGEHLTPSRGHLRGLPNTPLNHRRHLLLHLQVRRLTAGTEYCHCNCMSTGLHQIIGFAYHSG